MRSFSPNGIGENSAVVRLKTLQDLAILHPEIDQGWNERNGQDSNGRITKGGWFGLLRHSNR
jgi:acetate kinase